MSSRTRGNCRREQNVSSSRCIMQTAVYSQIEYPIVTTVSSIKKRPGVCSIVPIKGFDTIGGVTHDDYAIGEIASVEVDVESIVYESSLVPRYDPSCELGHHGGCKEKTPRRSLQCMTSKPDSDPPAPRSDARTLGGRKFVLVRRFSQKQKVCTVHTNVITL